MTAVLIDETLDHIPAEIAKEIERVGDGYDIVETVQEVTPKTIECEVCGKLTKGYPGKNGKKTVCFSHKKKETFNFGRMGWV